MLNVSRGGSVVARVVAISHEFTVAAAGGRALLSTRLSPEVFAAAAMRKDPSDLVAMKLGGGAQGGAGLRVPLGGSEGAKY